MKKKLPDVIETCLDCPFHVLMQKQQPQANRILVLNSYAILCNKLHGIVAQASDVKENKPDIPKECPLETYEEEKIEKKED